MFIGSHGFVCSLIRSSILRFLIARTSQHAVEPTHFEQTMLLECMQLDQACRSKEKQMIFVFKRSTAVRPPSVLHSGIIVAITWRAYIYMYIYICIFFGFYVHKKSVPPPCLLACRFSIPGLHVFINQHYIIFKF